MKKVTTLFNLLMLILFSDSFIRVHFYLTMIPSYLSYLFYSVFFLLSFFLLRKSKIYLAIISICFGLGTVVFSFSFSISSYLSNRNISRIESNPEIEGMVFYGFFPSKSIYHDDKREIELLGLNGSRQYYQIDTSEWRIED